MFGSTVQYAPVDAAAGRGWVTVRPGTWARLTVCRVEMFIVPVYCRDVARIIEESSYCYWYCYWGLKSMGLTSGYPLW